MDSSKELLETNQSAFPSILPHSKFSLKIITKSISSGVETLLHSWVLKKKILLARSEYDKKFPNITNSIDNLYLRCSLLNDSIVSGKRSNVLFSFETNTKPRSLPFKMQPRRYLWHKINTKYISEIRFYFTDDKGREVDLNEKDISLTLVLKKNGDKQKIA